MPTVTDIDHILPQTQCTKCGYDDCLEYAKAIHSGVPHNQCPPGGDEGIKKLSAILGRPVIPLNQTNGIHKPKVLAVIDESLCIGCKKCILACPVDAIVGSGKTMHTVIKQDCTGCELCVEPCPMDCIHMETLPDQLQPEAYNTSDLEQLNNKYRQNHNNKLTRIEKENRQNWQKHQLNKKVVKPNISDKKDYISNALEKFRQKKKQLNDHE